MAAPMSPMMIGQVKLRFKLASLAFFQAITGPIPESTSRAIPKGASIVLKKGGPTMIRVPIINSEAVGKSVHHRIITVSYTHLTLPTNREV